MAEGLELYTEEESRTFQMTVTGRLGGHYIPQNHFNLCPFTQRLLHIMVLWIHHTGEF